MRRTTLMALIVAVLMASCGSTSAPASTTTDPPPATTPSTTSTTAMTSTTTTSTTTTTTLAPTPQGDATSLIDALATLATDDRLLRVETVTEITQSTVSSPSGPDCNQIDNKLVADLLAESGVSQPVSYAGREVMLTIGDNPMSVEIVEVGEADSAAGVVSAMAVFLADCPQGTQEIPLSGPGGEPATDEDGNPIVITATLAREALELDIEFADTSAGYVTSVDFSGAAGDFDFYRVAFQRGPFVVHVTSIGRASLFQRLVSLADEALEAASK